MQRKPNRLLKLEARGPSRERMERSVFRRFFARSATMAPATFLFLSPMHKLLLPLTVFTLTALPTLAADKKIVFIAGPPSHGPGEHEHRAGCLLLQSCFDKVRGTTSIVYSNNWPEAPDALKGAATIVLYMDGGPGHPALQDDHLQQLGAAMKKGTGLVCIHYATEPTKEKGEKEWLDWIGGAFEVNWSVNPHWDANFKKLPKHPITRGVSPFALSDEWYFHIRLRPESEGMTPILTAVPDLSTISRPDGPHEDNPAVREAVKKGEPETVAWAFHRPDGGRGFGFTGAHFHKNWGNDNFRKIVLNAIAWTAKMDIPRNGIASTVTAEQLEANLDPKPPR
jgi:type 1 glutamine amidotransferase